MLKSRRKRFYARIKSGFLALCATFRRRNLKHAFRTVTFNRKEYLCFYLALLVIEMGFCSVALSTDADLHYAKTQIQGNYDYHFQIACLDNDQMSNLNNKFLYDIKMKNPLLEKVWYTQESDGSYTFFVSAPQGTDPSETLQYVKDNMLSEIYRGYEVRTSPLYEYETSYRAPYLASFFGVMLAWFLLSVMALVVLYLIRLDHFKFTYGIYMTAGADFTMLFGTAAGELMVISLLCFLPAMALGAGVSACLCLPRGIPLSLSLRTLLTVPLAGCLAVLCAVYLPMRRISRTVPKQLLMSADSGDLAVSPRRSFRIFGAAFPGKYELYTFWRMRKYYARLLISAVLFAALFVSGLYVADMQDSRAARATYEYIISYAPLEEAETAKNGDPIPVILTPEEADDLRTDVDAFLSEVNSVPGVDYTLWDTYTTGGYCQAHLLLSGQQVGTEATKHTVPSNERASEGYMYAMRNFDYTAIDKAYIDTLLSNQLCTVEGDPYALLEGDHQVILTEDVYNKQTYRFSPGETVCVAKYVSSSGAMELTFNEKQLLQLQIERCNFTYETYTVCAVIRGMPSEYNITFGVSYDDYADLTDSPAVRDRLQVYMQRDADTETVRGALAGIRKAVSYFPGWKVTPTGNHFEAQVKSTHTTSALTVTLAALLLVVSPLVWLFSQIMFYRKRQGEFELLHALGAPEGSIPRLYRLAGGVLSGAAFLVTVALTLLCNWVVYSVAVVLLPMLHVTENFYHPYTLSLPALIACVIVSVVCGFLSCEIPYRLYARQGNVNSQRKEQYDV